jgi:hypothetical protein
MHSSTRPMVALMTWEPRTPHGARNRDTAAVNTDVRSCHGATHKLAAGRQSLWHKQIPAWDVTRVTGTSGHLNLNSRNQSCMLFSLHGVGLLGHWQMLRSAWRCCCCLRDGAAVVQFGVMSCASAAAQRGCRLRVCSSLCQAYAPRLSVGSIAARYCMIVCLKVLQPVWLL